MAGVVAQQLPTDAGLALVNGANLAFVDAMTSGFLVSAIFVGFAAIVAITMIPTRMREVQAVEDSEVPVGSGDGAEGLSGDPSQPLLAPSPA